MADELGRIGTGLGAIGGLGAGIVPGAELLAVAGGLLAQFGGDPEEEALNPFYAPSETLYAGMYDPPVLGAAREPPLGGNAAAGMLWGLPVHPDDQYEEASRAWRAASLAFGGDQAQLEPPPRPDTPSRGLISYRLEVAAVEFIRVGLERVLEQLAQRPALEAAGAVPTFWYLASPEPWDRVRYQAFRKTYPFKSSAGAIGLRPVNVQPKVTAARLSGGPSAARKAAGSFETFSGDWGVFDGSLDKERWKKWKDSSAAKKVFASWQAGALELEAAIAAEAELYYAWRAAEAEREQLARAEELAQAKVHAALEALAAGETVSLALTAAELEAAGLPPVPSRPSMQPMEEAASTLPDLASRPSSTSSSGAPLAASPEAVVAGAGILAALLLL